MKEISLLDKSLKQLKAAGGKLGDKPLIVITAGKPIKAEEVGLSEDQVDQITKEGTYYQRVKITRIAWKDEECMAVLINC